MRGNALSPMNSNLNKSVSKNAWDNWENLNTS